MKNNPDASFYVLELSVQPGGSREWTMFVSNNVEDIKSALDESLGAGGAYMTLWYGREIWLRTYIDGEKKPDINLLPFITYQVDGYPPIGFEENGKTTGVSQERIRSELTDVLIEAVTDEETPAGISYSVNWMLIDPPPLTGNILRPGERTQDEGGEIIGYGINDLENGFFTSYETENAESEETITWEDEWYETEET